MVTPHQISQGKMVHHAGYGGLNVPPDLHRDAPIGPTALTGILAGGAAHRRQIAFQYPQDLTDGILFRLAGKQIAASRAADGPDQTGPGELSDDLFQIFIGNLLPLGDVPQRDSGSGAVERQIQHQAQGIAPFCGNFHTNPLAFF